MPLLTLTKIEAKFLAEILTIARDIYGLDVLNEPEQAKMADQILWKLRNQINRKRKP